MTEQNRSSLPEVVRRSSRGAFGRVLGYDPRPMLTEEQIEQAVTMFDAACREAGYVPDLTPYQDRGGWNWQVGVPSEVADRAVALIALHFGLEPLDA
jgi:hypothetical protein